MPYITNIEEEKLAMASRGCSRLIGYRVRVPVGVGQVTIRASPGNSLGPLIRAKTHIENIRHNGCNPDSSGSSQNARNGLVLKVTAPPVDFINKLVDSIPCHCLIKDRVEQ